MTGSKFLNNIKDALTENLAVSIIDVLLVAVLIYYLFKLLKSHNSTRLIKYIVAFLLIGAVLSAKSLGFTMLGKVFSYSILIAVLVCVIVYPQEVRRGINKLASEREYQSTYNNDFDCSDEELNETVTEIVRAVQNMAKKNVGALIIIATSPIPVHILESGTALNSKISSSLLECLFNTKAPLHDGAVFISGNRIEAAGCFLPLSQNQSIDKELGTRHRAAIGLTENYNMFVIIVSEETGVISVAKAGEISRYYDSAMLTESLQQVLGLKASPGKKKKKRSRF